MTFLVFSLFFVPFFKKKLLLYYLFFLFQKNTITNKSKMQSEGTAAHVFRAVKSLLRKQKKLKCDTFPFFDFSTTKHSI